MDGMVRNGTEYHLLNNCRLVGVARAEWIKIMVMTAVIGNPSDRRAPVLVGTRWVMAFCAGVGTQRESDMQSFPVGVLARVFLSAPKGVSVSDNLAHT